MHRRNKKEAAPATSILYSPGGAFVFPFIDPPTMRPRLASLIQAHTILAIFLIWKLFLIAVMEPFTDRANVSVIP